MTFHTNPPIPRLIAPGGPVSQALRIMREHDPEMARIVELRRAIANRIEADIALLDMLAGDPDLEDGGDAEPSLGSVEGVGGRYVVNYFFNDPTTSQQAWGSGGTDDRERDVGDEPEEEDEHGGNILDERHDEEPDGEADPAEAGFQPLMMAGGGYGRGSFGRRA